MFERFTEPARQAVVLAQDEARSLGHEWIGSEHLLLGLIREQHVADPLARRILIELGLEHEDVRARVVDLRGSGEQMPAGLIPFTANAKRSLELALRAAVQRRHDYIGTEHILLGVSLLDGSTASVVLERLGVARDRVAAEVRQRIG